MAILGSGKRKPLFRLSNPNDSPDGLTAAGVRVKKRNAQEINRLVQPWQSRAFVYYDMVPEINYAAQFYSRPLSVLRLYAAKRDEDGVIEETDDVDAVEMLARVKDPGGGGRAGLQAAYGRLKFLTGECYLLCSINSETEVEQWEMLSHDELRPNGSGYTRYKAPSIAQENYRDAPGDDDDPEAYAPLDDEAVAYRLWRRHPQYSSLADSTMKGVLDICEELVLLTQAVRARARSRLASAGILIVNGKVIPTNQLDEDPDDDENSDPFTDMLVQAMVSSIAQEGVAASVVPIVVRVDVSKEDGGLDNVMKHVQLVDPTQLYPETGLRFECVKRLAIGLDMPPEALLGQGDANHWTAWIVDEQTWKVHLQPVAQEMVDDLTAAYYQPSLKAAGVLDWDRYVIAYDASDVINHPDRAKDAKDLHDREALSDEALREASGFEESDAITDQDEWNRRVGIKLRDPSYVAYGIPSLKTGGIEPEAGDVVNAQSANGNGNGKVTVNPGESSNEAEKAPPPLPTGGSENEQVAASASVARVLGASDLALHRARELAGARVRNHAKRNKDAAKQIDGVRTGDVAAVLGPELTRELTRLTARELVAGAAEGLSDTLRMWGLSEAMIEPLAQRIEQHAAHTLFQLKPPGLPEAFEKYVQGVHMTAKA